MGIRVKLSIHKTGKCEVCGYEGQIKPYIPQQDHVGLNFRWHKGRRTNLCSCCHLIAAIYLKR